MATIRDIAKKAEVSIGTASRAITGNGYVSEENRVKVRRAAEELGYKPKEHAGMAASSKTVGIVLPDITFPFYGAFLKYAEVELDKRGYRTVVCNTLGVQNRASEMLTMVENRELAGLIINTDVSDSEIERMNKLPVVSFERLLGNKIPMVSSDHIQGGRLVAEEFIKAGCKSILILTVRHNNQLYGDLRIVECQKLLEEKGVKVTVVEMNGAMLHYHFFKDLIAEYMRIYKGVDGIFTDDVLAYCCVQEAKNQNIRIPDELRVIGYDGNEIIKIESPRITTVEQDIMELTRTCVDMLIRRINGEKLKENVIVPVRLLKGESS